MRLLQNVVTHGGPDAVARVHLRKDGRHLQFTISGSCGGLDPRSTPRGIVLSNMRRVEAVGAVTITSNAGHDAIVRGQVPALRR